MKVNVIFNLIDCSKWYLIVLSGAFIILRKKIVD